MRMHAAPLVPVFLLLAAACDSAEPNATGPWADASLALVSGGGQTGTPGHALADSIVVVARDAEGAPIAGALLRGLASGRDALPSDTARTDAEGRAAFAWRLGLPVGAQTFTIQPAGVGDEESRPSVDVSAAAAALEAKALASTRDRGCALLGGGEVVCWPSLDGGTRIGAPALVETAARFTALTAGGPGQLCGLTAEGAAWCWGANRLGATGTGAPDERVEAPTPVAGNLRFAYLHAGGRLEGTTCGIDVDGAAWCWGENWSGQVGDGTTTDRPTPVRVASDERFRRIFVGSHLTCALTDDGRTYCWGQHDGPGGALEDRPAGVYSTPQPVVQDARFADVISGWDRACGLTAGGKVLCWGMNLWGALGAGIADIEFRTSTPVPLAGGRSYTALDAPDLYRSFGIGTDGRLWRWGSPGGHVQQPEPLQVASGLRFRAVEGGGPLSMQTAFCGLTTDDHVYCGSDFAETVQAVPAYGAP